MKTAFSRAWRARALPFLVALALGIRAGGSSRAGPETPPVDVLVVGGAGAAVAAAAAAADEGVSVMLLAPRPYLGDDLCGRQRLWLDPDEKPDSDLARSLFPDARVTTPLVVKRALDRALLARRVRCLTGAHAFDTLAAGTERVAGVVMVHRGGREEVRAKVVIDATRHASVARLAGAEFRPFTPGHRTFEFTVVGGEMMYAPGVAGCALDVAFRNPPGAKYTNAFPVLAYAVRTPVADAGFAAWADAGQSVRDSVCATGMRDCSEYAHAFRDDTIVGEARLVGPWPGAAACDLAVFRPRGVGGLFVLGDHADLDPEAQRGRARPLESLALGARIGRAAADAARRSPAVSGPVRPLGRPLPMLGRYDVAVAGGGTAGAPAGIAAARAGARTLVVEYLDELGGVGTAGLIGKYWYGRLAGFTREVDEGLGRTNGWNVVQKSEWLRRELGRAGADVWLETYACDATLDKGRVTGLVVVTPFGPGIVQAGAVVDATGNADVAAAAGAATEFGLSAEGMLSVQLAGHPKRNLGDNSVNTCFALLDDTNARDLWHLMAWVRASADPGAVRDVGQLPDSRERRRIVADYMLTAADILNRRTFADTISQHRSNFDAAAFPTTPMLLIKDMKGPVYETDLPYRSLLPHGLDGILVTGLGAGVERDAMTLTRMQPDLQNQGYAAGAAAAMIAANGSRSRTIDIRKLQAGLAAKGVLDERVLTDRESPPMSAAALAEAVAKAGAMRSELLQSRTVEDPAIYAIAAIVADPERARPLLREALARVSAPAERVNYARILGVLGDPAGAATLVDAVRGFADWDRGFALTPDREKNNTFSELDRLVIALGMSGAPEGVPAIVAKLAQLTPAGEVSHYHAVAMALRRHGAVAGAVEPLARLLGEPGFAGHAVASAVRPAKDPAGGDELVPLRTGSELNAALKELLVAGMLVSAGDREGRGRAVVDQYAGDMQGHLARYARSLLR